MIAGKSVRQVLELRVEGCRDVVQSAQQDNLTVKEVGFNRACGAGQTLPRRISRADYLRTTGPAHDCSAPTPKRRQSPLLDSRTRLPCGDPLTGHCTLRQGRKAPVGHSSGLSEASRIANEGCPGVPLSGSQPDADQRRPDRQKGLLRRGTDPGRRCRGPARRTIERSPLADARCRRASSRQLRVRNAGEQSARSRLHSVDRPPGFRDPRRTAGRREPCTVLGKQ